MMVRLTLIFLLAMWGLDMVGQIDRPVVSTWNTWLVVGVLSVALIAEGFALKRR